MKGWTVVTSSTKNGSQGIAGREIYFFNKQHTNHIKTERIEPVWGTKHTMQQIAFSAESYVAKQRANKKGGRPSDSFAIEFSLNLPKGYRASTEQWKEITKQVIIDVSKALRIKAQVISEQTRAVLHMQDQTPELDAHGREQGAGDHIHLTIGKFTPNGSYLRDLQRKTITHTVKNAFNTASKRVCGFDWTEYRDTKLKAQEYANKKRTPQWKLEAARREKKIEQREASINLKFDEIEQRTKLLEDKESFLKQEIEGFAVQKRLICKFEKQGQKLLEAFNSLNLTQMNRQANRLKKTMVALQALGLWSGDINSNSTEEVELMINKMIKNININMPEILDNKEINSKKINFTLKSV